MSTLQGIRNEFLASSTAQYVAWYKQFKEIKNNLKELFTLLADLKAENKILHEKIDLLKKKLIALESIDSSRLSSPTLSQVLHEFFDRHRYATNSLVYGLYESHSSSSA